MTQIFTDVPDTETLKLSREPLTTRDVTARTMNSGTTLPSITDSTYEDMLGMNVFRTDELINKQFTEYDEPTSTATWTPILNGPTSAVSGNAALFDGTTGGKIKDSGIALPSGDVVGTTDTQTLTNKTLSNLTSPIALADGGTGQTSQTAGFDALSPISAAGGIISSDGTNNIAITAGSDGQILSADSSESSGLKWISQASGGGLELEIETADFTFESGKRHYVNSTSAIEATFPATVSVGDRFAIVTGLSDDVSIMTNASAATQSLIGGCNNKSLGSAYSAVVCGSIAEKMICVEFVAVSASEFAGYVNDIVANDSAGYFAGGSGNIPDKLLFSTKAITAASCALSRSLSSSAGASSSTSGYFGGGSGPTDEIDALMFSSEACSMLSAVLSVARYYLAAASSSEKAYFAGGYTTTEFKVIDALVFSSETCSALSATLYTELRSSASVSDSTKAYFGGGSDPTRVDAINRLTFSSDACSKISATLGTEKVYLAGVSGQTYGFFVGGDEYSVGAVRTIDRLLFSSETCSRLSQTLANSNKSPLTSESSLYGYIAGGYTGAAFLDEVDEFNLSSGVSTALSATLSSVRSNYAAVHN